jgi:hypothetical protein
MEFASKPGCPMCGIVSRAQRDPDAPSPSPLSPAAVKAAGPPPEILYRDDNFTVYRERAYPVSSRGHIVLAFK